MLPPPAGAPSHTGTVLALLPVPRTPFLWHHSHHGWGSLGPFPSTSCGAGAEGTPGPGGLGSAGPSLGCGGYGRPGSPQHPCPCRKEILGEYYSISSLVQEDVLAVHQEIARAIEAINPATEYSSFVQCHR